MKYVDHTGSQFGRLTVIERSGKNKHNHAIWLCLCECGNMKNVAASKLVTGATQSCGCFRAKHGLSKSKVYISWCNMKARCNNKNNIKYPLYGGRGIKVCKRWNDFENFLFDMGEPTEGFTLDRINNDGDYELSNCRWATPKEQANNRSNNVVKVS